MRGGGKFLFRSGPDKDAGPACSKDLAKKPGLAARVVLWQQNAYGTPTWGTRVHLYSRLSHDYPPSSRNEFSPTFDHLIHLDSDFTRPNSVIPTNERITFHICYATVYLRFTQGLPTDDSRVRDRAHAGFESQNGGRTKESRTFSK